jgi:hypothetical protein
MKKLTPEQVATIRNDASRGTGLSDLARKYGITWTEILGIVNHCSHRTPFDPPSLEERVKLLEKKVWNLEVEQERQSDWEREQAE